MNKAHIILPDGSIYEADSNLENKEVTGELVFNTSMTGYQEILTDPSYAGQIVIMTYPLIGNYGINENFSESKKIWASGFIIKENGEIPAKGKTFSEYLAENDIICLSNIDTRMLTKKIRSEGSVNCHITTKKITEEQKQKPKEFVFPKNIIETVCEGKIEKYEAETKKIYNFALIDYGVKTSIIENLRLNGADVTVYPYNTDSETILNGNFDALMLSNGPGDPKDADIKTVKELIGKLPIFGICLGHQLLALALGGDTYKLKFGHRGANHPVINLKTGKVIITSQNHGYAVKEDSLPKGCEVIFRNINDDTVEGIENKKLKIKSVQFHPEAAPGTNDAKIIFKDFLSSLKKENDNA